MSRNKTRSSTYKGKRRRYLNRMCRENKLFCEYCNQQDLIIYHCDDPEIPSYRKATVDHIVPLFAGGDLLALENWVVACKRCNQMKEKEDQIKYKEIMELNK